MDEKEKDPELVNTLKIFQYVMSFQVCSCYCLRCFVFSGEKKKRFIWLNFSKVTTKNYFLDVYDKNKQ